MLAMKWIIGSSQKSEERRNKWKGTRNKETGNEMARPVKKWRTGMELIEQK